MESEHGTIQGEIRNISLRGIYVRCDDPLCVNEDFRMAIIPPDRQAELKEQREASNLTHGLFPTCISSRESVSQLVLIEP